MAPSFTTRSSLIDVGYNIVLYFKQSIFSYPTLVKIPIYIGTYPIQNNQTHSIADHQLVQCSFSDYSYRPFQILGDNPNPIYYFKNEEMNKFYKKVTYSGNGPFYPFYCFQE